MFTGLPAGVRFITSMRMRPSDCMVRRQTEKGEESPEVEDHVAVEEASYRGGAVMLPAHV